MLDVLRREGIYLWYYFSIQLEQIWGYWVLGMVLGSVISVFAKDHIHSLFCSMHGKRLGVLGIVAASALGIASPLCMYGAIPLAASFSDSGMEDDWLAAFMMSSILLNPQLILYSMALGPTTLVIRVLSSILCGIAAGLLIQGFYREPRPLLRSWLPGLCAGSRRQSPICDMSRYRRKARGKDAAHITPRIAAGKEMGYMHKRKISCFCTDIGVIQPSPGYHDGGVIVDRFEMQKCYNQYITAATELERVRGRLEFMWS